MVFPSRALIGRCALRSTRALERLVTATMPSRVTHAVPIVPFVLAREAGAWTEGTRCPTWLVPWLGWAQLEATKKVAMIYQGETIFSKLESHKKHIKIGEIGEKTLRKCSRDLTLAMSRSKGQHEMTWPICRPWNYTQVIMQCPGTRWSCPQEFLLNFKPSICKSFTLSFILGCTRLYLFAKPFLYSSNTSHNTFLHIGQASLRTFGSFWVVLCTCCTTANGCRMA